MSTLNGTNGTQSFESRSIVQDYYARILRSNQDLKTNACCTIDSLDPTLRDIVAQIHPAVLERFYGCGSPIPPLLEGMTVLDLGSGSGRDTYVLSKLVGARGKVIGVDMTPEQVAIASSHISLFETGLPMLVCGNTASMLADTRFSPHFEIIGSRHIHFGLFPCVSAVASTVDKSGPSIACC